MTHHPLELARLLLALGRAGVELARHQTDPARLRCRPALDPDTAALVRSHRAVIVALLADGLAPARGSEAEYVLAERLGVADELAMPTHPGSPAWCVAAGEALGCDGGATPPKPAARDATGWAAHLATALGVPVVVASVTARGDRFPGARLEVARNRNRLHLRAGR